MVSLAVAGPIFILAPARSCSSVVTAMLGRHLSLYDFPELRLFRADTVAGLLQEPAPGEGMPARERAAGLLRTLAQLHEGDQSSSAVERALRWLEDRDDWPSVTLFDHLLRLVSPKIAVEKSPETSLSDIAMQRMSNAFPAARYIHLVRHPWSTVVSMVDAWLGLRYWHVSDEIAPRYCLGVWYQQHRRIAAFGAGMPPDRFLRIRAEDVVNRPRDALPRICGWLGIDAGDESIRQMLEPDRSPYATPGPANAVGGYDPKFLHRPQLRPLPSQLPKPPHGIMGDRPLYLAALKLALEFGYDGTDASEPAQVYRLRRSWWVGIGNVEPA